MEIEIAYSEQFRKEVMEYIDGFYSQDYVAKLFNLSPKTVWNWIKNKVRDIVHLFQTLEFAIIAVANIK